ncbi:hypothetical protein SODALDRAFT_283286 [Sodiomyces alkalinus F11]|uniref:DUF676 domain-containing protein n=1 Tax=Sodiomyces alkalinus (strain CBS 110278 / VKM F-3762 / F11) TaxID=1314773 RepID=A0A3N2PMI5_SODAK|nr:hypothetical protein SODALDRAFT_283286 [Sodiomyces alkalinus F11]ROT35737.1 hypothetical protein SODALDRAFT_283286 [Sodiomyces alkalinus F11]
MGATRFFGSQVGGQAVINYAYTDLPSRLLMWDIYYFFYYAWALPWILMPIGTGDDWPNSGHLDELAWTWQNAFCIVVHAVLVVLQMLFLLWLPFVVVLPIWTAAIGFAVFFTVNWALCLLLNGPSIEYHSDPHYAPALPEHADEQWIFINGVAVGDHWMRNNLNRLALTFKRPVLGIHNRTSGIVFDVVECLIQRNLSYATSDVRLAYRIVKQKLYEPRFSRVIFILHSQGGIVGGLVLDWLLQELPQDLLSKLEVYTFGNAANHFNNPHRHVISQALAQDDPLAALTTTTTEITQKTRTTSPISSLAPGDSFQTRELPEEDVKGGQNGSESRSGLPGTPSLRETTSSLSSTRTSSAARDRALGHVEHYAHTTDFVALWGVLHFCTSQTAQRTIPRFIGRLFARASDRGGHQFCQHYLNGMFPLERDPNTGRLVGCAEDNEFMESEILVGSEDTVGHHAREAFEISWLGSGGFGSGDVPAEVAVHGVSRRKSKGVVKVKELSRLWMYRNGMSPPDVQPWLVIEKGVVRNTEKLPRYSREEGTWADMG